MKPAPGLQPPTLPPFFLGSRYAEVGRDPHHISKGQVTAGDPPRPPYMKRSGTLGFAPPFYGLCYEFKHQVVGVVVLVEGSGQEGSPPLVFSKSNQC